MSTSKQGSNGSPHTPAPFSADELAEVAGPLGEPELDEVVPAEIEDRAPDLETPFEKLAQKSKKLGAEKVRAVVEALLFVSDKPLDVGQLYEATGIERELIEKALAKLTDRWKEGSSGVVLSEVAGGWQLRTDALAGEYVRRFLRVKPQRLTRAAVETLAIIAYRQPVTRPEIEDIRGVDSGAVVKALLERRLIKILGKKEEIGRPILYGTTREFLEFFALKDLASLPTLREFQELSQEHQEILEKDAPQAPVEAVPTLAELAEPTFQKRMDEIAPESEAALADLERAIDAADTSSKTASTFLGQTEQKPE